LESAWRFGSRGPEIYDYVIIGMPYSESSLNESHDINTTIPAFYDENWNVIWNTTNNGTSGSGLGGNFSDYSDTSSQWEYLMNGTNCTQNVSEFNISRPCYKNTTNNMIWLRIPHFSGVGPRITGTAIVSTTTTTETTSNPGSSSCGEEGKLTCDGDDLEECQDGSWAKIQTCSYGCEDDACLLPEAQWESISVGEEIIEKIYEMVSLDEIKFILNSNFLDATLSAEEPTSLPDNITELENAVYKYIKINTNIEERLFESAEIKFKVGKSWLDSNNVNKDTILLNRYSEDGWQELETTLFNESDVEVIFNALSPAFSYFAVTGQIQEGGIVEGENEGKFQMTMWIWIVAGIAIIIILITILFHFQRTKIIKLFKKK
jgi:PGF-pre-PGF domain-containing protein